MTLTTILLTQFIAILKFVSSACNVNTIAHKTTNISRRMRSAHSEVDAAAFGAINKGTPAPLHRSKKMVTMWQKIAQWSVCGGYVVYADAGCVCRNPLVNLLWRWNLLPLNNLEWWLFALDYNNYIIPKMHLKSGHIKCVFLFA